LRAQCGNIAPPVAESSAHPPCLDPAQPVIINETQSRCNAAAFDVGARRVRSRIAVLCEANSSSNTRYASRCKKRVLAALWADRSDEDPLHRPGFAAPFVAAKGVHTHGWRFVHCPRPRQHGRLRRSCPVSAWPGGHLRRAPLGRPPVGRAHEIRVGTRGWINVFFLRYDTPPCLNESRSEPSADAICRKGVNTLARVSAPVALRKCR
jgi:hypothetical protein